MCLCILSRDCIRSQRGVKLEGTDLGLGADSEGRFSTLGGFCDLSAESLTLRSAVGLGHRAARSALWALALGSTVLPLPLPPADPTALGHVPPVLQEGCTCHVAIPSPRLGVRCILCCLLSYHHGSNFHSFGGGGSSSERGQFHDGVILGWGSGPGTGVESQSQLSQLRLVPSGPCWYRDFMLVESCRNPTPPTAQNGSPGLLHPSGPWRPAQCLSETIRDSLGACTRQVHP